jgi:uncharacterized protein (DUF3084 family)
LDERRSKIIVILGRAAPDLGLRDISSSESVLSTEKKPEGVHTLLKIAQGVARAIPAAEMRARRVTVVRMVLVNEMLSKEWLRADNVLREQRGVPFIHSEHPKRPT